MRLLLGARFWLVVGGGDGRPKHINFMAVFDAVWPFVWWDGARLLSGMGVVCQDFSVLRRQISEGSSLLCCGTHAFSVTSAWLRALRPVCRFLAVPMAAFASASHLKAASYAKQLGGGGRFTA